MSQETFIADVRKFTEAVGCTTDRFNVRQTALYIGLQLEEMAEKLEACYQANTSMTEDLHKISALFKCGDFDHRIESADRAAMLDADIDLAWVTIGSALSQGADVLGACGEVARANLAKLVECHDGRGLIAIKDANGKVKKPDGWIAPDITPFIFKGD